MYQFTLRILHHGIRLVRINWYTYTEHVCAGLPRLPALAALSATAFRSNTVHRDSTLVPLPLPQAPSASCSARHGLQYGSERHLSQAAERADASFAHSHASQRVHTRQQLVPRSSAPVAQS